VVLTTVQVAAQLNTHTLMVQGRQKLATDQYFDAITILSRIIVNKPDAQEALFFRGIAKFNLNDFQGAKKDFQTCININPFYSHAYHYLGITEDRVGNYTQAFKLFDQAIKLSPYDAYIYLNRGVTHLHLQQFDLAINDLDSAIILRRDIPEAYLTMAMAYEEKDDNLEALLYVNKAIKLNPFMGNAYLRRALLKYKRENYEGALQDIEMTLKIDKDNPLTYYYKANIFARQKRFEEALEFYNIVLKMDPKNALVYYNRAILNSEIEKDDEAIEDFSTAIRIKPDNILIYFGRALEYYHQKQFKSAISDLNKIIEIYPLYPKAYQLRGQIYSEIGQQVKANTDYFAYQEIVSSASIKTDIKSDSLLLAKIIDFESDFVNVEKVKDQRVQYRNFDLSLFPDVFFFMRQPLYNNPIYDNLQEIEVDDKAFQMVYYFESPIHNLDSIIELYEKKKISYFNYFVLGTSYGLNSDFNSANEFLTKAIALNPKFAYAYVNRAYFNSKLNDYLIEIDEKSVQSLSMDGKTNNVTNGNSIIPMVENERIVKDLSIANSIYGDVLIQYNLANVLALSNNFLDAIFWYNKSIQKAPELKWALFNKALIQIRINDNKSACQNLSKAGELGLKGAYPVINKFCRE